MFKSFVRKFFIEQSAVLVGEKKMEWVFIVVILAALFIFVKATNLGQNLWSYVLVAGALFLLVTIIYVSSFTEVSLTSFDGIVGFGRVYVSWLGTFVGNLGAITGSATHLDWGINNTAS